MKKLLFAISVLVSTLAMFALQMPALAQPEAPSANHDISIVNFAFQPATKIVGIGDTVTWTNSAATLHTTTSDIALWDSGNLSQNASFALAFNVAGIMHTTVTGIPSP